MHAQENQPHEFEGYIINSKGDSIAGNLVFNKDLVSKNECHFKSYRANSYSIYKPHEIMAYGLKSGKKFKSLLLDDKITYFLEVLIEGHINLYYQNDELGTYYYIRKNKIIHKLSNDLIVTEENKKERSASSQYKFKLKEIFSDSSLPVETFFATSYSNNGLTNVCIEYLNNVQSFNYINYNHRLKSYYYFELINSVNSNNIEILKSENIGTKTNSTYGVRIRINPKYLYQSFHIITGFSISALDQEFTVSIPSVSNVSFEYANLDIAYVSFPVGFNYYFNKSKLRPYALMQYELNFMIKNRFKIEQYYITDPNLKTSFFSRSEKLRSLFHGIKAEVGLNYQIDQKKSASIGIHHTRNSKLIFEDLRQAKINSYGLLLSFTSLIN